MKKGTGPFVAVVFVVCMLAMLIYQTSLDAYPKKITVNGAVYEQKGDDVSELPANSEELGRIYSIVNRYEYDPVQDFDAANLDKKYCGNMIYQVEGSQVIYLEDLSGFYIPFEFARLAPGRLAVDE